MGYTPSPSSYILELAQSNIANRSTYNKFGVNKDIDTGSTPEDVWEAEGEYTGFNATSGEAIGIRATGTGAGNNTGSVLSSGTATGGSLTTLVDTGASFGSDGVSIGDLIINDTQSSHGIVTAITTTTLTVLRMSNDTANSTDAYRIATSTSTGAAVVKVRKALESDYANYINEYVVLNGSTEVDTVGTDFIRCSRGVVVLSGSSGGVESVLEARQTTTTSNVFWTITEGHNQTLVACDTIPACCTLYANDIRCRMARANGSAGSAEIEFFVRDYGEGFVSKIHEYISTSEGFKTEPETYMLKINSYADIKWRVHDVSDNNSQFSAQINGTLITN